MAGDPTVTINVNAFTTQANQALAQTTANVSNLGNSTAATGNKVNTMTSSLGRMTSSLTGLVAAYVSLRGAMAAIRGLTTANMSFEDSMAAARAVTEQNAGFTEAAFKGMSAEARRLGATTRFSASEAAQGLKFLGMAGFTAEQATISLSSTLQLAQAGALDLGRASDIVSNIMTSFGADASQTQSFVDALAKTAATSNNNIQEIGDAMAFAGAALSGFGQEVSDGAAAIAVLGNAGIKAGTAGAGLRMVLAQLSKENGPTVKALREMGVAFEEINPATNNLIDIFERFRKKGIDVTSVFSAFDVRAANTAQTLIANSDALREYADNIADSEGAASQMADTMDNTFGGSLKRLKSAWQELLLTIGDSGVMEGLRGLLDRTTGAIGAMVKAVKILAQAFQSGDLSKMFFLALKLGAMRGVNFLLGTLVTAFKVAIQVLISAFQTLTSADYWSNLWKIFKGAGMVLLGIVSQLEAELLSAAEPFVATIWSGMSFVIDKMKSGFMVIATSMTDAIAMGLGGIFSALDAIPGVDFSEELEDLNSFRRNAQEIRDDSLDVLTSGFDGYGKRAREEVSQLIKSLREGGTSLVEQGAGVLGEGATNQAGLLADNFLEPIANEVRNFEPLDVFGNLDDSASGELSKLWADNLDRVAADTKNELENVGAPDNLAGLTDEEAASRFGGASNADVSASSLQVIGGGGGFSGASSDTENIAAATTRTANATEVASAASIGTATESVQQTSLLKSILDVLGNIRDSLSEGGNPVIQIS